MSNPRTRAFSWQDPQAAATAGSQLSGMEYLQAMARGELPGPPVAATLDFTISPDIAPGKVTFLLNPQEFHYNPIGSVHGGVIATVLDSAVGCAVHSMLPAGTGYTSLELKVNFIKAVRVDTGPMRCEGAVLSLGRRTAVAEGRLLDATGKLYAHCTTTCIILTP